MSDEQTSTDKFSAEDGMPLRATVLHIALMIEERSRWAIGAILPLSEDEIKVIIDLNFNQRIQFLTDLEVFTKEEKARFGLFQKIRNKLVHHIKANTLEKCFELLKENPEHTLLRDYHQDKDLPMEERLWNAMQMLINDISKSLGKIEPYVNERIEKKSAEVAVLKGLDVAMMTMLDVMGEVTGELVKRVNDGRPMTRQEIIEIPARMSKRVTDRIEKSAREKIKTDYGLDLDELEARLKAKGEDHGSL